MKNINKILSKLAILVLLISVFSCSENEVISKYHFNNIQEFKVEIEGQTIYAEIKDNNVVLNWPQSIEIPEKISPSIIASEKATVTPASGTEVNINEEVTFSITAENGVTKVYNLIINELHPNLKIEEVEEKTTANYSYIYTVYGEGFSKEPSKNKVFLVAADGKETPLKVVEVRTRNNNGYGDALVVRIPKQANLKEGNYKVKVSFGNKSYTTTNDYFNVKDLKLPVLAEISEDQIVTKDGVRCLVVKENEELFIKGENLNALKLQQMFVTYSNASGGGTTSINVRAVDDTTIAFSSTFWNTTNFAYQKAYVAFKQPDTWKTLNLYLHDTKGDFVGVYFEQ